MKLLEQLSLPGEQIALLIVLVGLFFFLVLSRLRASLAKSHPPFSEALAVTRNFVLPAGLLLIGNFIFFPDAGQRINRILETVFGIAVIYAALSSVKGLFFAKDTNHIWRARVPNLFLDLTQFAMVAVGAALVVAWVWERDLGGFLATLGIGSIVLGLALQDTLGNVFAGIALLFERPFSVGDWVQVGDRIGTVIEINWRAVRIRTRSLDMVVVPNQVLGKEMIINFSRPDQCHGIEVMIGFSYDDPPNKVKRVLQQCAAMTPGILPDGIVVRTTSFDDFSISYQSRFFITDYDRMPDITEDFKSRVWYAMRREGLTIPYPIRTVHKTEIPYQAEEPEDERVLAALRKNPLFSTLTERELQSLSQESLIQNFAAGELIVSQGAEDTTLYIIKSGMVSVAHRDSTTGESHELARLGAGDFFGEMSMLTGERRAADVSVLEDCELILIYKESLRTLLADRPALATSIAEIMHNRLTALNAQQQIVASKDRKPMSEISSHKEGLVNSIRSFFGLR